MAKETLTRKLLLIKHKDRTSEKIAYSINKTGKRHTPNTKVLAVYMEWEHLDADIKKVINEEMQYEGFFAMGFIAVLLQMSEGYIDRKIKRVLDREVGFDITEDLVIKKKLSKKK